MRCQLCGEGDFEIVSSRDAKSKMPLTVSQCGRCGLVQQTPMPTADELQRFYATQYRLEYKGVTSPKPKHIVRSGRLALDRIACLKAHLPTGTPRNLMDIGAGGGEFVYLYRASGLGPSRGIEPNHGYCEHARSNLEVEVEPMELHQLRGAWQVISMFHVLEHLIDPLRVFEKLWDLLEPGGLLFVEVPFVETHRQSLANTFFRAHTLYFSELTLVAAASGRFENLWSDTATGCVRGVFRRRESPRAVSLPDPAAVAAMRERLRCRNWWRYLQNGGAVRPLQTLWREIDERRHARGTPRTILDRLLAGSRSG